MYQVTLHGVNQDDLIAKLKMHYRRALMNFNQLGERQFGQLGELKLTNPSEGSILLSLYPLGLTTAQTIKARHAIRSILGVFGQYTPDNAVGLGDYAEGQYMGTSGAITVLGEDMQPKVHLLYGGGEMHYQIVRKMFGQHNNCCPNGLVVTLSGQSGEADRVAFDNCFISHQGPDEANAFCNVVFTELLAKMPKMVKHLIDHQVPIRLMPVL